jgi:asparagine synthase (glutamine-hydrolysing)
MCGIAGVLVKGKPERLHLPDVLTQMSFSLATRGPDAEGVWVAPTKEMGFAHRRLSIIDVNARSDQPMHSPDGRYTIVFNGEIYNYQLLREELRKKGRRFTTTSDTEVLLAMYAEHGAEMLTRLRGMYAFGIWDRQKRELFLARDPFGIKPLYYADAAEAFSFASQVRSLMSAPDVDLREEAAGHVVVFPVEAGCG